MKQMSYVAIPPHMDDFPGAELVREGIEDLRHGRDTTSAALVSMAAPRLRFVGVDVPAPPDEKPNNIRLYDLLDKEDPASAHSRYNALVRRIVSFASAAEHDRSRRQRDKP